MRPSGSVTAAGAAGRVPPAAGGATASTVGVLAPPAYCILARNDQKLNPAVKAIRSVPVKFGDIAPDYEINTHTWGVFISLRFHVLHPGYLAKRLGPLRGAVKQLIVFCQVDVEDSSKPLLDITTTTIDAGCTLIVGSSADEVGRYIESFKQFENKPAAAIQERTSDKHAPQVITGPLPVTTSPADRATPRLACSRL